ncbi:hypothetical protein QN277_022781 [Acacia crassicarpa]|uniref:Uncharacterized protein n=1 Tax=Acacia crassicarpa TaxID=499986 RepID=A0AAE1MR16_9FABA|nr:hypothetical protein QN277_022781 [Acacia crassicarpa]
MSSSLKKSFMYLSSAHEIWEALRETYSTVRSRSRIFGVKKKLWELKQEQMSLDDYYLEKSVLWQEFDALTNKTHHCGANAKEEHKEKEEERVYELLAGLNVIYDDVQARILSQEPLPSVREVYVTLRDEEDRRKSILQDQNNSTATFVPSETSALAVRFKGPKNRLVCDHCHKQGHKRANCWDLHGKPTDWKPRKEKERDDEAEASNESSKHDKLNKIIEMLAALQTTKQPISSSAVAATVDKKESADVSGVGGDYW